MRRLMALERGFVRLAAVSSALLLMHAGSNSAFGLLAFPSFNSGTFTATSLEATVLSAPTVTLAVDGYSFTGDSSVQVADASPPGVVTVNLQGDFLFTISSATDETINSFITVYAGANYLGSSGAATLDPLQSSLQTQLLPAFFQDGNYFYDMYDPVSGQGTPIALSATGTNSQGLPGYSASETIGPFSVDPSNLTGQVRNTDYFDLQWKAILTFTGVAVDSTTGPETLDILLPGGATMDPVTPEPSTFAMLAFTVSIIAGCWFARAGRHSLVPAR